MAVQLKKFGAALTTRSLAARIVSSEINKAIQRSRSVLLDFSGVNLITQSFADELVRDLVHRYGRKSVALSNANETTERIIQHAIAARWESPRRNRPMAVHRGRSAKVLASGDSDDLF